MNMAVADLWVSKDINDDMNHQAGREFLARCAADVVTGTNYGQLGEKGISDNRTARLNDQVVSGFFEVPDGLVEHRDSVICVKGHRRQAHIHYVGEVPGTFSEYRIGSTDGWRVGS